MDVIDKDEFENIEVPKKKESDVPEDMTEEKFRRLLDCMNKPAEEMKQSAIRIKIFLDVQIKKDMETKGFLTDFTRRWMKDYNDLLKELQKALYGDKSTNLHLHAVSHSTIASKMRKHKKCKTTEHLENSVNLHSGENGNDRS